jgi:hypothetical protein
MLDLDRLGLDVLATIGAQWRHCGETNGGSSFAFDAKGAGATPGGLSQSPENFAGRSLFMRDNYPGSRSYTRTIIGQCRHLVAASTFHTGLDQPPDDRRVRLARRAATCDDTGARPSVIVTR